MTQPPDPAEPQPSEPTAPLEPPVPSAPVTPSTDDQPTVAWTPTDPAGSSSEPATPAPVPDAADTPASPIISAAPLAGAAGASGAPFASADPAAPAAPGAPPPAAADAPLVGWTPPGPAAPVATSDGFVLAGVGARFVAFLLDAVVVAIVPGILMILVSDFSGIADAIRAGRSAGSAAVATPVTMQSVLIELIGLGINFLYFVGLWTSGWRATLGQRLLSIQVADAATGHGLSLAAASKRWLAFGAPLNLLAFVPGAAGYASLLSFGLAVLLLITTIIDQRNQGLQDKFANSLVIRRATSGSGAVLAGCLALILIVGLIAIVYSAIVATALAPELKDLFDEIGNSI